jgi:TM2 domain-containing membrane protein YozV
MAEVAACPFCESEISATAKKCRHCGEWVSRDCLSCGTPVRNEWAARGFCANCGTPEGTGFSIQPAFASQMPTYPGVRKSRSISVGLALIFGGLGAHKFYLDKPGKGFLYLLFSWTGIPTIIGLFEAVKYIRLDEEDFQRKAFKGEL